LTEPQVLYFVLAFLVLLASLTVHEAAHAVTADRLGDPTARTLGRASLNPLVHIDPVGTVLLPLAAVATGVPLIGWAKPVPVVPSRLGHPRRDFMLVAAAGPASNLALAVLAAIALRAFAPAGAEGALPAVLVTVVQLNILLAIFNLVPVPPLDGGNVLSGLLPPAAARGFDALRPYGFLVLYGLMLSGWLWTLIQPPYRFLTRLLSL
jgi:Zn-dependent protease